MAKKMLIDATHAEETRVVVVDGNKVEEFDFESENKRQLAGNIYLAKVTRVEPSLQAAFVDYGGNRHGFLAFSEIHPDYYQIPVADRQALMEEEAALAAAEDDEDKPKRSRSSKSSRSRSRSKKTETPSDAAKAETDPATDTDAVEADTNAKPATPVAPVIGGMETIDLSDDSVDAGLVSDVVETGETQPSADIVETTPETVETVEPVVETVEDAPVETVAEDIPAVEDTPAVEDMGPTTEGEDAAETEADIESEEKPQRPMAANSSSDDPVIKSDPIDATGSTEDVTDTSADTPAEEVVSSEGATADAEPVAEEASVVEAVSEETPAEEADATVEDAPETVAEDEVVAEEAAPEGAAEDEATAEDADATSEETAEKPAKSTRSRSKSKSKKDASDRDETIESVADDDTEEDIRPARKPRPRRYKIQEVIKVRQIMLVQVVKEERGNKGAALTTYLSLAGRYCVLMPNTARGGGISRKITNAADRSKLKAIAAEIDVPKGAGLIVRTAGAKRTKTEIKRDYEYLQRLWEQIRELTLKSVAPAKIYEEGDLIKRSIRDLYSREIEEVLVEGERGYRVAKDFMKMIMPSHAKNVQHYQDQLPLFARYQVETYLGGMFNPVVQLKSGGYIVIGVTEALVAVDVNSGRATKEGSIEETALKTNLEAAEEVARQLRLRDLAGLIVIDFIDMDERKNNTAVEKRMKDKLKTDRARIQVGRISGFGLMEMSRQRLRPGMIEATTQPCPHCHGTGLIRSDDNMALQVLRQIEEEGTRRRTREVLVKVPVAIGNYLINQKREHIAQIEARYGMSVRIELDPHLVAPDFSIEKFKTATRNVPIASAPVVSVDTSIMDAIDEAAESDAEEDVIEGTAEEVTSEEDKPKKKRRRRRRKSKSKSAEAGTENGEDLGGNADSAPSDDTVSDAAGETTAEPSEGEAVTETPSGEDQAPAADASTDGDAVNEAAPVEEEKPKKRSRTRRSRSKSSKTQADDTAAAAPVAEEAPAAPAEAAPVEATPETVAEASVPTVAKDPVADTPVEEKPKRTRRKASDVIAGVMAATASEPATAEPVAEAAGETTTAEAEPVEEAPAATTDAAPKPKRRGWWSIG